ncbi:hypothetical protein HY969_04835 [Candidatus Kaiserbacteria bacterium]|nr:hypothetical protein [Candidatus Kaiserbacteria bacterium]
MRNILIVLALVAVLGVAAYWYSRSSSHMLPIASGDSIESWDFQGSYNDDGPNEKRARDEIVRSEAGLEDEATDPTDYVLYVSISNQYMLLGEGKAAYEALGKALEIDAEKTGLAWHNLGSLMERLGAINTARIAYEKAAEVQPVVEAYHSARVQFLLKYFPEDSAALEAAFSRAERTFGTDHPVVMQLRYEWLVKQGKTEEAAAMLERLTARVGEGAGESSFKTVE